MKKYILPVFFLLPIIAFADIDISGCNVIGYQTSRVTEKSCKTKESCEEMFEKWQNQEDFDDCIAYVKTPEECEQFIAEQQELARKRLLIYKCPITDILLQRKMAEKDVGTLEKYAYYSDGTPINTDAMITDSDNVYLFLNTPLMVMDAITENSKLAYYIIGPVSTDNLMFTWLSKE